MSADPVRLRRRITCAHYADPRIITVDLDRYRRELAAVMTLTADDAEEIVRRLHAEMPSLRIQIDGGPAETWEPAVDASVLILAAMAKEDRWPTDEEMQSASWPPRWQPGWLR